MAEATADVWEAMSTCRSIRRFTNEPVDDATLARCLEAARWAPSGANAQQLALRRAAVASVPRGCREGGGPSARGHRTRLRDAADRPMTTTAAPPARTERRTSSTIAPESSRRCSSHRRNGRLRPSCSWAVPSTRRCRTSSLAARALGLGTCFTSSASYGGEPVLREAVGVPDDWMLAGHVVVGWPRGRHGPVRRRPLVEAVNLDRLDAPAVGPSSS